MSTQRTAASDVAPQTGRVPSATGRSWFSVAAVLFAVAWAGNEFTPLLVMYQMHSGFAALQVNILFGGYVLGIIPALLIGGPMADRLGRRPVMIPGPLLAMAGSLVLALGPESMVALFIGRLLCGLALGLAMAVGSTWIKELSTAPFDASADAGAGARRASITLSVGFGAGAAVAGAIAQWGPAATMLPYLVNIALLIPVTVWMLRTGPETQVHAVLSTSRRRSRSRFALIAEDGIDPAVRRRFLLVVAPAAPWVFGCAGSAYAILPTQLLSLAPGLEIGFSALMCLVGLTCGVGVQPLVRRLERRGSARTLVLGLMVACAGMLLAASALAAEQVWLGLVAAAVLGTGYGTVLVSGLQYVQRIAPPGRLAAFTAVFYSLTYLGFFMPAVLSGIELAFSGVHHVWMFTVGAVLALVSLAVIAASSAALRERPTEDAVVASALESGRAEGANVPA
ncbi:MFS transporter [Pseudoclavibacter sp. 13-3]|uniref:MFS transporter n=1 Tax=Pseudoclavibacter sp. 13-3 TaxID=2901228 RepID=UPI001E4AB780|nr:MFS transporter [Pseudoclavibacter sp. 13-3]MCD7102100.1 MFS transporter [Pseudoclavibacter sp. 13-3]